MYCLKPVHVKICFQLDYIWAFTRTIHTVHSIDCKLVQGSRLTLQHLMTQFKLQSFRIIYKPKQSGMGNKSTLLVNFLMFNNKGFFLYIFLPNYNFYLNALVWSQWKYSICVCESQIFLGGICVSQTDSKVWETKHSPYALLA